MEKGRKMLEFKVNEVIKLKLENGITKIYINNKYFLQCKYILTKKKINEIEDLIKIKSIDEFAELSIDEISKNLNHSLEEVEPELIDIPAETRFWAHCSNIQTWVENGYNSNLLHSNLAFPLLKKLNKIGDQQARKIFKEEIAKRFCECHPKIMYYLIYQKYLHYLNREELDTMLAIVKNKNSEIYSFFLPILIVEGLCEIGNLNKQLLNWENKIKTGYLTQLNLEDYMLWSYYKSINILKFKKK